MKRLLGVSLLLAICASVLLSSVVSAAGPSDTRAAAKPGARPTAYVVIGQVGGGTVDLFALKRNRAAGTLHVYEPSLGYLTAFVRSVSAESDGSFTATGRGRLTAAGGKLTAVKFIAKADPATKKVELELTEAAGGAAVGKITGTLTSGTIKVEPVRAKAPAKP